MYALLLAGLIAFVMPAQAQKIHYGVKAGVNFAVQSGIAEYYDNSNIRIGLHAGLAGSYDLNKNMMLLTEVNYEQEGSHSSSYTERFDYISVPILYDYSIGKVSQSGMTMHLNAGPYISFLVNAKKVVNDQGGETTTNLLSGTDKAQLGAIFGIGLIRPVGKHELTMDLMLNLGLNQYNLDGNQAHNKLIGVYVGYML